MRVPQNQKVVHFIETTNLGEMPSRTEKGNLDQFYSRKWEMVHFARTIDVCQLNYRLILSVTFAKDTLPPALQATRVAR